MTKLEADFTGRTALVTGSAQGLGAALTAAFHAHGATVVALDVDEEANERTARALGDRVIPVRADIGDLAAIEALLGRFEIDILVNNAARAPMRSLWEITPGEWDAVMETNLRGTFFLSRAVAGQLRERGTGGRILNLASIAGQTARSTSVHYGASKAGIIAITRVLATELAADGITVNAIAPAMIDTPMVRTVGAEKLAELTKQVPLGRIATPEEVANLAVFLASEHGAFITGATYDINGGVLMR